MGKQKTKLYGKIFRQRLHSWFVSILIFLEIDDISCPVYALFCYVYCSHLCIPFFKLLYFKPRGLLEAASLSRRGKGKVWVHSKHYLCDCTRYVVGDRRSCLMLKFTLLCKQVF